jgi:hypothetical protein
MALVAAVGQSLHLPPELDLVSSFGETKRKREFFKPQARN